jgi:hypothetical protein
MVALLAAFGAAIWTWSSMPADTAVVVGEQLRERLADGMRSEIQWVIIAVVATILSVVLSIRLMRSRV